MNNQRTSPLPLPREFLPSILFWPEVTGLDFDLPSLQSFWLLLCLLQETLQTEISAPSHFTSDLYIFCSPFKSATISSLSPADTDIQHCTTKSNLSMKNAFCWREPHWEAYRTLFTILFFETRSDILNYWKESNLLLILAALIITSGYKTFNFKSRTLIKKTKLNPSLEWISMPFSLNQIFYIHVSTISNLFLNPGVIWMI